MREYWDVGKMPREGCVDNYQGERLSGTGSFGGWGYTFRRLASITTRARMSGYVMSNAMALATCIFFCFGKQRRMKESLMGTDNTTGTLESMDISLHVFFKRPKCQEI